MADTEKGSQDINTNCCELSSDEIKPSKKGSVISGTCLLFLALYRMKALEQIKADIKCDGCGKNACGYAAMTAFQWLQVKSILGS